MKNPPLPLTRELVLIGGGHTHALVLRKWGMTPVPGVRLTLINPGPSAPYTGMLPGFVAGHYRREDLSIDLVRLARFAGARLILGNVQGIDRDAGHIHVPDRAPVAYDLASINVGITSDLPDLPGFNEHAVSAKPLGPYAQRWTDFRTAVANGDLPPDIAVIGGGVGGAELSLAMAHALQIDGHRARITVIEQAKALPGISTFARKSLLRHMDRMGVRLIEGATVTAISSEAVHLQNGLAVVSRFTIAAAGARPHDWLADTGLNLSNGFICVDHELRSCDPAIYAAGDCAALPSPRPKAGVFAVRQAPILYHNLRAELTGGKPRRYSPQRKFLKLISLGHKSAVADRQGGWLKGAWLKGSWMWHWKDRIDRRFMTKFTDLPAMPAPAYPQTMANGVLEAISDKPLCGGCGAKIGSGTLAAVLGELPSGHRGDIFSRPGDDAAILCVGNAQQVITTDHLRAFTDDPWTLARIAAVHALGDIWAMGATPQAALATVILPRMAGPMQAAWLTEIMTAAATVFIKEGAEIVGGHSSIGDELTVGFSVTGLLKGPAIRLGGAQPEDALILTKPIGSGTILAGEMALAAHGSWLAEALTAMQVPQGDAANLLRIAHAMTDVTGFGLAGHLMAICRASNVAAELNLAAIPFLNGAESLAKRGIRSTLYPENRKFAEFMSIPDSSRAELLFDPQTAGGLLAAVPAPEASRLVTALNKIGHPAAKIGKISAGSAFISVT